MQQASVDLFFLVHDPRRDQRDRDKTDRAHLTTTLTWKILDWVEREKKWCVEKMQQFFFAIPGRTEKVCIDQVELF
jgi:hypothetical protein